MPAPTSKQPPNGESLTKRIKWKMPANNGAHNNKKLESVFLSLAQSLAAVRTYHTTNIQQQKTPYKKGTQLQEQARPCKCTVRQIIYPLLLGIDVAPQFGTLAPVTKLARLHRRLKTTTTTPSSKYNSCLVWSNMLEDGGDQWLVMVRTSTTPCCSLHE